VEDHKGRQLTSSEGLILSLVWCGNPEGDGEQSYLDAVKEICKADKERAISTLEAKLKELKGEGEA
jgi:hypothetical protein